MQSHVLAKITEEMNILAFLIHDCSLFSDTWHLFWDQLNTIQIQFISL